MQDGATKYAPAPPSSPPPVLHIEDYRSTNKKRRSLFQTAEALAGKIALAEEQASANRELRHVPREPPFCSKNPCDYLPKKSTFEPREINFGELAARYNASVARKTGAGNLKEVGRGNTIANRDWSKLPHDVQAELIRDRLTPKVVLLDPNCMFMKRWDFVMILCLFYVASVTPYEVSFLNETTTWDNLGTTWLFWVNALVDLFFVLDMIFVFNLKVVVENRRSPTKRLLRTRGEIARNYIRGWFMIDLLSIIPFDILSLMIEPLVGEMLDVSLTNLKSIKMIRLLRMIKLIRVLRASRVLARWENHISISYQHKQLISMISMLIFVSHLMGCIWGLTGHFNLVMDCSQGYPIVLSSSEGTDYPDGSMDINHNWLNAAVKDASPDNMCDHVAVYLWSLHWSVMTITSIGYGDFTPQRMEEYIVGIICMFVGGIMWAYIIGNLCATMGSVDPIETSYRTRYDQLNGMLEEHQLPNKLRVKARDYMRESKQLMKARAQSELMEMVSASLRGEVSCKMIHYKYLRNVPYFSQCGEDFLVELCQCLEPELFAPREDFPRYARLWVIIRGSASQAGRIFLPGMYLGEDFVLDSLQLQHGLDTMAMTYCECKKLSKNNLVQILKDYPLESKVIRKHALMIAWRQAVRLLRKVRRGRFMKSKTNDPFSKLFDNNWNMTEGAGQDIAEDHTESLQRSHSGGDRLSIRAVDKHELFGCHDYFRERNMRRAEREFGQSHIREEADPDDEMNIDSILKTHLNGVGMADKQVNPGSSPETPDANDGLLSKNPSLDELRDELNIQRTLMNRILTRLESGALFQGQNGSHVRVGSKSPDRHGGAPDDVRPSSSPTIVQKNGSRNRGRTPSPAGIARSPQSAKAAALRKKKLEQAPLPGAMPY